MKLISPGDGEGFRGRVRQQPGATAHPRAVVRGRARDSRPRWSTDASCPASRSRSWWEICSMRSRRSALSKREGRDDVCALPYGISTPGLFAHVFLVMLPARQLALARGIPDPERFRLACGAGRVLPGRTAGIWLRVLRGEHPAAHAAGRDAGDPRQGSGWVSSGSRSCSRLFASPVVGLVTLVLVFIVFFGRVRIRGGGIPATLVVLIGRHRPWPGSPAWPRSAVPNVRPLGERASSTCPGPCPANCWPRWAAVTSWRISRW